LKTNKLLAGTLAFVLVIGISTPAFGQEVITGEGTANPGPGGIATTSQVSGATCTFIDFEGVGNSVGPPIIIGDATFTGGVVSIVDNDAGGSGNFANEPSPDTVILVSSPPPMFTLTFANPVSQLSWFYVANGQTEVRFFDSGNGLLATVNPPVLVQGVVGGDPNGFFDNWDMASHSEGSNTIKKVEFERVTASGAGFDDMEFCIIDSVVGGTLIPLDTTALMLAGLQSSAIWMIPTLAGLAAAGFYLVKFRMNKE